MMRDRAPRREFDRLDGAAIVIGLAISGFFDGILLHQVLQWHHFLSLVPGQTFRDLRVQVFADGLFHVFVYGITITGLALLWRARECLDRRGAGRQVVGSVLIGFGLWNIVDVGLFHWVLGIHRIRVNVPNPLAYDLAWFVGLGVVVAALGWWVRARGPGQGGRISAASAVALLFAAIPVANRPVPGANTLVVFGPGVSLAQAVNGIVDAGGAILVIDPEAHFAVIALDQPGRENMLYRAGALLVSRSPTVAGCAALAQVA